VSADDDSSERPDVECERCEVENTIFGWQVDECYICRILSSVEVDDDGWSSEKAGE
jgi:hypothetical protein